MNGVVTNGRPAAAAADAVLADEVGHPEHVADLDELHLPKVERLVASVFLPVAIRCFRLWPPLGYRKDESFAPLAGIAAYVNDYLRPGTDRGSCITDDVSDRRSPRFRGEGGISQGQSRRPDWQV